ncbi:MAG: thioredoxin family protein [Kiritimatiellaceae bacterium]|nr:thioredoxin family protein [Kiritimatiellaceae bacterium]
MKIWQKLLIVIALIGAVAFVIEHKKQQGFSCAGGVCTPPPRDAAKPVAAETSAQKPLPRLVDLGAGQCVPCKMMVPILDELKTTFAGKLEVVFIDVWENKQAGEQYGIRMIPTQIFYDAGGKELFRHEGFFSKEDILAKWKELGVSL